MKTFNIHERNFIFVVNTLKLIKYLPKSLENQVIVNQLIRSVTSVGANDQEADGVSSKKDFIHCYTIVRKELKETEYWLMLLIELNPDVKSRFQIQIDECDELIKIISSIISKASLN